MRYIGQIFGTMLLLVFVYLIVTNPMGSETALNSGSKALSNIFMTLQGRTPSL